MRLFALCLAFLLSGIAEGYAAGPLDIGPATNPMVPNFQRPAPAPKADVPSAATMAPTPLVAPTEIPSPIVTSAPTVVSTPLVTLDPTLAPTPAPTMVVTAEPTLAPTPEPTPVQVAVWERNTMFYAASISSLSLSNGDPLAYSPIELGYQFANGLRVSTGLELFYYEGLDTDAKNASAGIQRYTYQMNDWRLSVAYLAPITKTLRPLVGLSADFVGGDRALARVPAASKQSAYSYIGLGATLGGEWMYSDGFSLSLLTRGIFSLGERGVSTSVGLGWQIYF